MTEGQRAQWDEEIKFFDQVASTLAIVPLKTSIVERYAHPVGPWSIDFMFRLAGDVTGRRVLDVGAGTGENALVLAALGAQVTAVDISAGSLDVLNKRAHLSGLSKRVETICTPIEQFRGDETFEVVWADAFLHHVIPGLEMVVDGLLRRVAPGGRLIMSEPTSPHWLRRFRLALPIPTSGTPGERPLEATELDVIRSRVPGLHARYFYGLSRVDRFVPGPIAQALAHVDRFALQVPGIRQFGSVIVMWADRVASA